MTRQEPEPPTAEEIILQVLRTFRDDAPADRIAEYYERFLGAELYLRHRRALGVNTGTPSEAVRSIWAGVLYKKRGAKAVWIHFNDEAERVLVELDAAVERDDEPETDRLLRVFFETMGNSYTYGVEKEAAEEGGTA